MGPTRYSARRRARRILSLVLAGLLAVLGAGVLVLGTAEQASAVPMIITSPADLSFIGTTTATFTGQADPNEPVEVDPGTNGNICNTTANALGNWSCDVTFTESALGLNVTATGLTSLTTDTNSYDVSIQPVITETVQFPGFVYSNLDPPEVSGIAEPFADIDGLFDGVVPCATVADGLGAFTCTAVGILGADGDYSLTVTSTPAATLLPSDVQPSTYHLDSAIVLAEFSVPLDTAIFAPVDVNTTDTTPLFLGDPGTTEPFATVTVLADDFGAAPIAHPTGGAITPYCSTAAAADGSWSCTGAPLTVGRYWQISVLTFDLAGNGSPSPDDEFGVHILPPPPPPVVLTPVIGYQSLSNRVYVSTTNLAEGTMYVREGGIDRCPPTPVAVSTFSCTTAPLAVGVHTLDVFQEDQYGTFSPVVQRTVNVLPPPPIKYFSFQFRVIGPDGEIGDEGVQAGDEITIEGQGLPLGATVSTEIHSTPIALGSTTIGPSGTFSMPVTVPAVDAGEHEIVVFASAPGYEPGMAASPVQVRDVKQFPEDDETELEEPGEEPAESADHGGAGGGSPGSGLEDPTVFGSALSSPFDLQARLFQLTVAGVALSGGLSVAFLLLVGLPAELLESTIRSNYDRTFGWLARIRRRLAKIAAPVARLVANPWVGSGLTILAAAVLLGFADPGYGLNGASVRLTLAMLLAVVAINVGLTAIVMRVARRAFDVRGMLQPMPAALLLVGLSVLVSRLAGISPGFLFGIVLGVVYARELRIRDEGRLGALGVGLTIAAGVVAWFGYGLASLASGPGFWNNLVIETLAAITLEALGTLVIALLPIDFVDGRAIFRWSKLAWAGLYVLTLLVFLFVVVPMSGNWGVMSAPIFGWGTLFVVFGVVAIATWALFRRFPAKGATPSSRRGAEAPPRSQR
jgi:hypothetical protein